MTAYRLPLLLACLLVAAPAAAEPARTGNHRALAEQCRTFAADPRNPWALAHGITGLGPTFSLPDGRSAAEVMIGGFLEKASEPAGGAYRFARAAPDGTPVEPHANLLVKTLVGSGQPLTAVYRTRLGEVSLAELVHGVKRGFRHDPGSEAYWQDAGWTLDLLAATLEPGARFTNGAGQRIAFDRVMDDALAYLERANASLEAGLKAGAPLVPKRKQGIYAHACGGLHLVQAVGTWARHPEVRARWGARFDRQVEILYYRLGSERQQYDAALAQAPQYRLQILVQQLKFYGHFLETTGRLRDETGYLPTPAQRREIELARRLLDDTARQLFATKAYERMDGLKATQRQVHLDLIGDSCHATNGWDYWP